MGPATHASAPVSLTATPCRLAAVHDVCSAQVAPLSAECVMMPLLPTAQHKVPDDAQVTA
eukprot:842864-Prorocentrum_minimum.AAC.2